MKKICLMLFSCALLGNAAAQDFKPHYSNNFDFGVSYTAGTFRENFDGLNDAIVDHVGLQFNYIGLYHLSPKVAVGAGTGLRHMIQVDDYFEDWDDYYDDFDLIDSYFSIPLYAHARFRFLDRRVSPFLATSIGYQFRVGESTASGHADNYGYEQRNWLSSGLLANVQAGVSIHIGPKFNILAGPYFEYRQATNRNRYLIYEDGSSSSDPTRHTTSGRDMNFFEVGAKVGFAF